MAARTSTNGPLPRSHSDQAAGKLSTVELPIEPAGVSFQGLTHDKMAAQRIPDPGARNQPAPITGNSLLAIPHPPHSSQERVARLLVVLRRDLAGREAALQDFLSGVGSVAPPRECPHYPDDPHCQDAPQQRTH